MSKEYVGQAASPGILSGLAFVIDSLYDASPDEMQCGDVLVVRFATPLYFEFYVKAGAIVTEVGGVTCHAAGIAREMGIPCVVSVENILSSVKTGDHIIVDGSNGVIRVEEGAVYVEDS